MQRYRTVHLEQIEHPYVTILGRKRFSEKTTDLVVISALVIPFLSAATV